MTQKPAYRKELLSGYFHTREFGTRLSASTVTLEPKEINAVATPVLDSHHLVLRTGTPGAREETCPNSKLLELVEIAVPGRSHSTQESHPSLLARGEAPGADPLALSCAMWPLRRTVLCLALFSILKGQSRPGTPGVLQCGLSGFQFTASRLSQEAGAPVFTAWDHQGLPHRLHNDSDCGTWVREGPSSVVLEASYSGCYVSVRGSYHVMTVSVEGQGAAEQPVFLKRILLRAVENPYTLLPRALPRASRSLPTYSLLRPRTKGPWAQDQEPSARAEKAPEASGDDDDLCDSVPLEDRVPCVPAPVSREVCEGRGCCFSPAGVGASSCHYGNKVTSHCTREGRFSIVVSQNVTSPPLRLDSVRLVSGNDSGCEPVGVTQAFVLFQFPFTSCGTTRQVIGDQAVYENELVAAQDVRTWGHGAITRDSIFRLRVSCSYSVNSNTFPVSVQVLTVPPPLSKAQLGRLSLDLQIAKDKNYGSYYEAGDYPVVKFLQDPVYVEVSILHRNDPDLGLLLGQCWATPGPSPLQQPQWPILVKGCPYAGDNYRTQLIPVKEAEHLPFPSHHQRFSMATFSFVDPTRAKQALSGQVYLHCSVLVCQPVGMPACKAACPPVSRRRKSDVYFHNSTASISSKGPMILLQVAEPPSEKLRKYSGAAVDPQALWVASLAGTLVVGALLVSYLAIRRRSRVTQTNCQ
ncbi:zona pellucida sperm-binding protein 4 [Ctenodactylus gundi]